MIKTKEFSYDLIYEQIQDFCIDHNITKDAFRSKIPALVYEQTLLNNVTQEQVNVFGPSQNHPLFFELTEYLENKYGFKSELIKIISLYDDVYNLDEASSLERTYYLLDDQSHIRMANTFEFMNLEDGDYDILMVEVSDSHLDFIEDNFFDFYKRNVIRNMLPEDLNKPLYQLTQEEIDIVRMIFI